MSMAILAAFLAAGFAAGRFLRLPGKAGQYAGCAISGCLFLLVLLLGIKLGADGSLMDSFQSIGAGALVMGIGCTAGSIVLAGSFVLLRNRFRKKQ